MIFASIAPSDLNRDPEPMVGTTTGNRYALPFSASEAGETAYERPRPEFGQAQHNAANPILCILREAVDEDAAELPPILDLSNTAHYILNALDSGEFDEAHAPEELAHARRVLTRLAIRSAVRYE